MVRCRKAPRALWVNCGGLGWRGSLGRLLYQRGSAGIWDSAPVGSVVSGRLDMEGAGREPSPRSGFTGR